MRSRGTFPFALLLWGVLAGQATAQVAAPKLVDDEEPAVDPSRQQELLDPPLPPARSAEPAPRAPLPGAAAQASAPGAKGPAPEAVALPPSAPTAELAREIVPVSATHTRLLALWTDRRAAVREADPVRAERAVTALLATRRELGIENLYGMAAAEVRESRRALAAHSSSPAVAHAEVAVQLAPDLPDAHLALARSRFAHSPGNLGPVVSALGDAAAAASRDPHTARAFEADILGAGLGAFLVAAIAVALVLLLRHLRLFLHDLQHLPIVGAAGVQAAFLALLLLAAPLFLGLGAFMVVAVAALVSFPYQSLRERLVTVAAVGVLVALPYAAGEAVRLTWWTGTLAEQIDLLERGAPSDAEVAALAASAADATAPAPLYAALGRHYKRRGHLVEALRFYRAAEEADPRAAEIQVNTGNVLLLQGDLEGAKAAYLGATDRAGSDLVLLGAAHYNLSKLYLRTSDMEKSAASREKAEREAGGFLRRYGSDDDFSANRYVVDVPVPFERLEVLARGEAEVDAARGWVRRRVAGALPADALGVAGALLVVLLALSALAARKLGLARACEKCGGASCRRCDRNAAGLCGACINVFTRKGVVDARDRLRKESEVRRHERLSRLSTRALALVGGGLGQLWSGRPFLGAVLLLGMLFLGLVIVLWRGLLTPPLPTPYVLAGKLAVAVPLGLVLWAVAVRDAFRRTE